MATSFHRTSILMSPSIRIGREHLAGLAFERGQSECKEEEGRMEEKGERKEGEKEGENKVKVKCK